MKAQVSRCNINWIHAIWLVKLYIKYRTQITVFEERNDHSSIYIMSCRENKFNISCIIWSFLKLYFFVHSKKCIFLKEVNLLCFNAGHFHQKKACFVKHQIIHLVIEKQTYCSVYISNMNSISSMAPPVVERFCA